MRRQTHYGLRSLHKRKYRFGDKHTDAQQENPAYKRNKHCRKHYAVYIVGLILAYVLRNDDRNPYRKPGKQIYKQVDKRAVAVYRRLCVAVFEPAYNRHVRGIE